MRLRDNKRLAKTIGAEIKVYQDIVEDLGNFVEAEIMIDTPSLSQEKAQIHENELIKILHQQKLISDQDKKINIGYVELYLEKNNPQAYNLGLYKR